MSDKPRIVILDDDEIFASLITESLGVDCEVVIGRNGREGIQLCLGGRTDLLITDIGMPELDGIQMLQEFQKDPRLTGIPVIVVTATHFSRQNRSDVNRYPQVRDIIHKSSALDAIVQEVQKALKEPRGSGPEPK
jgi:CheY-like chemotaxis protein